MRLIVYIQVLIVYVCQWAWRIHFIQLYTPTRACLATKWWSFRCRAHVRMGIHTSATMVPPGQGEHSQLVLYSGVAGRSDTGSFQDVDQPWIVASTTMSAATNPIAIHPRCRRPVDISAVVMPSAIFASPNANYVIIEFEYYSNPRGGAYRVVNGHPVVGRGTHCKIVTTVGTARLISAKNY